MKITPLEIRQKSFEKKMRGYDKDEVNAFLVSLSQEWERLNAENKEQQIRIESLSKDVQKLREVESSLFKTLKVAEDTSSGMKDQARKDAELHLREAHLQAEALVSDAREQARNMLEEAEQVVKESLDEVKDQVKTIELEYKQAAHIKENFLFELKSLAQDILQRSEKFESKESKFQKIEVPDVESIVGSVDLEVVVDSNPSPVSSAPIEQPIEIDLEVSTTNVVNEEHTDPLAEKIIEEEKVEEEKPKDNSGGSFFDSI